MAAAWFIHWPVRGLYGPVLSGWSKKRRHDGTTGQTTEHLEVDTPWATVPSLLTCDGHTTGH